MECLTRAGRLEEVRLVFERMLTYANDVGLFAEEVGDTGEALSAAWGLNRAIGETA